MCGSPDVRAAMIEDRKRAQPPRRLRSERLLACGRAPCHSVRGNTGGTAGQALELRHVVSAENRDVARAQTTQLAQPMLIPEPRRAVLLHHQLVETEPGSAPWILPVHLAVIE